MNSHYPAPGEIPAPHPASEIFPLMAEAELEGLAKDIKRNGLREPVVILDNLILDGRNRLKACQLAKIDPTYRFFDPKRDGKSPIAFVMSKNTHRRQMTPSQLAAVATLALPIFEAEAEKRQSSHHFPAKPATTATETPPKGEQPPSDPDPKATAAQWQEDLRTAATGIAELAVLNEALKLGHNAEGEPLTAEQVAAAQERRDTIKAWMEDNQEAVNEIVERTARIDGNTVELDPEALNGTDAGDESQEQRRSTGGRRGSKPARVNVPTDSGGKAAAAAAAAVGVSTRSVETAKHLQKTAPEKFEEVKKGAKSLHAAAAEAKLDSDEVQEALLTIRRVCGQSFHDAVKEQTRLKGAKEILAFAALEEDTMINIRGLVESGWSVKEAVKYKAGDLCVTHKIRDLLNRAAHAGGQYTLEVEGWVVSVSRKAEEMPATAAADATKAAKRKAARDAK